MSFPSFCFLLGSSYLFLVLHLQEEIIKGVSLKVDLHELCVFVGFDPIFEGGVRYYIQYKVEPFIHSM
jgi:hypothetical protein